MKDRILKLAENVTDQQKNDINSAPFISLCLDESIDTTKSARLAVFARYCVENIIKEELIAITSLLTTTKGTDICTADTRFLNTTALFTNKPYVQRVVQDFLIMTATAGSDVVQSGRPIFDEFFRHLWPYIGNNTANVVFQMVKRLWLIRIDQ
ncbi:general transcription factor II-I repeat domain-containing protein 2A [Trichonephila clavipes]|nr:general transcription factor II-I repeat domain-containing protein 2A [Trichonephila clavipes]